MHTWISVYTRRVVLFDCLTRQRTWAYILVHHDCAWRRCPIHAEHVVHKCVDEQNYCASNIYWIIEAESEWVNGSGICAALAQPDWLLSGAVVVGCIHELHHGPLYTSIHRTPWMHGEVTTEHVSHTGRTGRYRAYRAVQRAESGLVVYIQAACNTHQPPLAIVICCWLRWLEYSSCGSQLHSPVNNALPLRVPGSTSWVIIHF